MKTSIFWFRRDLRLTDNIGLNAALASGQKVLPIFIFDSNILDDLERDDARLSFIHETLKHINDDLNEHGSTLQCYHGNPIDIWKEIIAEHDISDVFINKDYEPYAISRDLEVEKLLGMHEIQIHRFKDQVIFEENEITKNDGLPYTVYTPFKNKWLAAFYNSDYSPTTKVNFDAFVKKRTEFPTIEDLGFVPSEIKVQAYTYNQVSKYEDIRDYPEVDGTSYLSPHLRFGTVSVRQAIEMNRSNNATFLSELIWREFFMQILFHFPKVVHSNFKSKYDGIQWRNNEADFKLWCEGKTGYPMVDAGMRQLNKTGYMHNRVRMVVAGFLVKHLLIDWKWGEAYFAQKLLDYDLSANNGNWQWSSGTGCDSAPYFRIFNPIEQLKKFDKNHVYINTWIEDLQELTYPQPMVDHKFARERALLTYKKGLE